MDARAYQVGSRRRRWTLLPRRGDDAERSRGLAFCASAHDNLFMKVDFKSYPSCETLQFNVTARRFPRQPKYGIAVVSRTPVPSSSPNTDTEQLLTDQPCKAVLPSQGAKLPAFASRALFCRSQQSSQSQRCFPPSPFPNQRMPTSSSSRVSSTRTAITASLWTANTSNT